MLTLERLLAALTTPEPQWALSFSVFMVELGVLVLGIPAYLRHRENRKWRAMRQSYPRLFWDHYHDLHRLIADAPRADGLKGRARLRRHVLDGYAAARNQLVNRLLLLGPSMTADISIHVDSALRHLDWMEEQLVAVFRDWDDMLRDATHHAGTRMLLPVWEEVVRLCQLTDVPLDEHAFLMGDEKRGSVPMDEHIAATHARAADKLSDTLLAKMGKVTPAA
mgnify:CR=1 FL=1